jgi:hypothetical protein
MVVVDFDSGDMGRRFHSGSFVRSEGVKEDEEMSTANDTIPPKVTYKVIQWLGSSYIEYWAYEELLIIIDSWKARLTAVEKVLKESEQDLLHTHIRAEKAEARVNELETHNE